MTLPDLSPEALARISPKLTLATLGRLADPPLPRETLCRLLSGKHRPLATTVRRVQEALRRAERLARQGKLPDPLYRGGRKRK